ALAAEQAAIQLFELRADSRKRRDRGEKRVEQRGPHGTAISHPRWQTSTERCAARPKTGFHGFGSCLYTRARPVRAFGVAGEWNDRVGTIERRTGRAAAAAAVPLLAPGNP